MFDDISKYHLPLSLFTLFYAAIVVGCALHALFMLVAGVISMFIGHAEMLHESLQHANALKIWVYSVFCGYALQCISIAVTVAAKKQSARYSTASIVSNILSCILFILATVILAMLFLKDR